MRKRENYRLRALAMARALCDDSTEWLARTVQQLDPGRYDWHDRADLGISATAWARVATAGLSPTVVFCHPDVVMDDPRLIAYYRGLAMLPHKGMSQLATATGGLEAGRGDLSRERSVKICRLINEVVGTVVENLPRFLELDASTVIRSTGAVTTDGRWRNAIGEEASRIVKEMIVRYLAEEALVESLEAKTGQRVESPLDARPDEVAAVQLTNGHSVHFASEPDIELRDAQGRLTDAIEVKGGLDPAGALERYGAAKKSFAKARARNSAVRTTLLMSAITEEVSARATQNTEVHDLIDLDGVLLDEAKRGLFLAEVRYKARL